MKLPIDGLFAHQMSFPDALTPTLANLRAWLQEAKRLGYKGLVIVPALFDNTKMPPNKVAEVFKEEGMEGIVCGFNPGNSHDPLFQPFSALFELERQASYTVALAKAGCGPRLMIGPVHTHHMHMRPDWGSKENTALASWVGKLSGLAEKLNIKIAIEPLNEIEDGTPDPFGLVHLYMTNEPNLGIHFDTGHAHHRKLGASDLARFASKVFYLELVTSMREICGKGEVNFKDYGAAMFTLGDDTYTGVEPFDPIVVNTLGLQALCQTSLSGPENLLGSITYLRSIGVV
jgi:sugar phosphate isomerase/epimerase